MYVNVGIDIGSTTVKIVVVRDGEIIHKHYERHFSKVREKAVELVRAARGLIGEDTPIHCSITGSAGLGVAKAADIDFVQEVFATRKAVGVHVPAADVVIELGGEDAKIVFLTGQLEERMNGSDQRYGGSDERFLRRRHRRVHRPDGGTARRYPVRA